MKPTIGRIVLYQRHGSPNGQHKAEPSPAIVTGTHEDDCVDLCVFNPTGLYFDQSVRHDPSDDPKAETDGKWAPGCWRWPPRV